MSKHLYIVIVGFLGITAHGGFQKLPVDDTPSTLTLSEDAKTVIVGCESAGKVYFIDTITKKILKTVDCPSPRHVISRGSKAYVASYGHGKITEISCATGDITGEFTIPAKNVFYLSAPRGKFFEKILWASALGKKRQREFYEVRMDTKTHELIRKTHQANAATLNYEGTHFMFHHNQLVTEPSGIYEYGETFDSWTGGRIDHIKQKVPVLMQVRNTPYWLGDNEVYYGFPPKPKDIGLCQVVAADISSDLIFKIHYNHITAHRLDNGLIEEGSWPIAFPQRPVIEKHHTEVTLNRRKLSQQQRYTENLAVELGGKIHLFVCDPPTATFYFCELEPDRGKPVAPGSAKLSSEAYVSLPIAAPAEAICMTENGRFLLAMHPDQDRISVWGVLDQKVVATLETPTPTSAISRGGNVYVANRGHGTLSVFAEKDWSLMNEVLVGTDHVFFLSAPKGKYFNYKITATCKEGGNTSFRVVDCKNDETIKLDRKPISNETLGSLSYDGSKLLVNQRMYEQFSKGSLWFEPNKILTTPPKWENASRDIGGTHIIPDMTRKAYYDISNDKVLLKALNMNQTIIREYQIFLPSSLWLRYQVPKYRKNYGSFAPSLNVGATHGETSFIFLRGEDGLIYACMLPASEVPSPIIPSTITSTTPPLTPTPKPPEIEFVDSQFQPLLLEQAASSISLTEDGHYLIISQITADKVSVWDVVGRKMVSTISLPKPDNVVCRKSGVFIKTGDAGEIVQFSAETWARVRSFKTAQKVLHMSAPGGQKFEDELLLTCKTGRDNECQLLDLKSGHLRKMPWTRVAPLNTFSYSGQYIIHQNSSGTSASWITGSAENLVIAPGEKALGILQQFWEGDYWFGSNSVYAGMPPHKASSEMGKLLVPDTTHRWFFTIDPKEVKLRSTGLNFPIINTWPVTVPSEVLNCRYDLAEKKQSIQLAATIDGNSHIFVYNSNSGRVFTCRLPNKIDGENAYSPDEGVLGPGLYSVNNAAFDVRSSSDKKQLLLNTGNALRILDADGIKVIRAVKLERNYKRILARKYHFICLADNALEIRDRNAFSLKKRIQLPTKRALDCALHPGRSVTFVTMIDKRGEKLRDPLLINRLAVVDEESGKVSFVADGFGKSVAVDPAGRYLFTGLNERRLKGQRHLTGGAFKNDYQYTDYLISYDIFGDVLKQRMANKTPGRNGQGICLSPCGKYISYVSTGGLRFGPPIYQGYTVPAFDTEDLKAVKMAYDAGTHPLFATYHPMLPLVAVGTEKTITLFHRETGDPIQEKFSLPRELSKVLYLQFSASGRQLLIGFRRPDGRRLLTACPLNLSAKEEVTVSSGPVFPDTVERQAPKPKPPEKQVNTDIKIFEKIDAKKLIQPVQTKPVVKTFETIASEYMESVVVIRSANSSGTGFFVSEAGHVLTCAHAIPESAQVFVSYKWKGRMIRSIATVLAHDNKRDLALLKIDHFAKAKVKPAYIFENAAVETGDKVCAMGHPGVGAQMLDYTISNGIISSAQRTVGSKHYIQSSIHINGGMAGGPMFNRNGRVIGVIVSKAYLDGVALAVPHNELLSFFKDIAQ